MFEVCDSGVQILELDFVGFLMYFKGFGDDFGFWSDFWLNFYTDFVLFWLKKLILH
jgi:hypothetical protein